MARREVLDEEPFEIDLGDEEEQVIDLADDDEGEDEEEPLEEEEEEAPRKRAKTALTDEDLDTYQKEQRELRDRTTAAELAAREATDIATAVVDKLEKISGASAQNQLAQQKAQIAQQIANKRKALKTAFEEGDAEKHSQLTEDLADLKGQQRILAIAEEQQKQQPPQRPAPQQSRVHPKAQAWVQRNPWFTANEEARLAAVYQGNLLERQGVSPSDDAYYEKIDAHMRKRFPEIFNEEGERPVKKAATPTPPVRGVERSGGAGAKRPGRVKLTPLQVSIAKKWGLKPEDMAKEVLKQRKREEI